MSWRSLQVMDLTDLMPMPIQPWLSSYLFQNTLSSYFYQVMLNSANSDYLTDALEAGFEVALCPSIPFPITIKLTTNLSI